MKLPLSTRIARRFLRYLPARRFAVAYEPGLRIPMADGVELLADHYFPDSGFADAGFPDAGVQDPEVPTSGEARNFPTLLVRSPYGRGSPWAARYGVAFAEQGFHVLLQSARGTAGSGGVFQPWRDDGPDGRATIAWLRRQTWFDGRLGLIGSGAMTYAQWALAAEPPPELKAMVVQSPLHNPHGFFHRSGVFAYQDAAIATAAIAAPHPVPCRFLAAAASHPDPADGYWQGTDLLDAANDLRVPTLVVSGWHDAALDQALQQYGRLPATYRSLLVGPWSQTTAFRRDAGTVFTESLAWLHGHLVGPAPPKGQVRIAVSVGGTAEWRDLPSWTPPALPTSWYLHSDGVLAREPPVSDRPIGAVHYAPADPTPALALAQREDVLVFTSPPLPEVLEAIGAVAAEVLVGPPTEASSATLFVRLCDVDRRGRSSNVCDGITRITSHDATRSPTAVTIPMSSTAHRFEPGHRLRLQISGGTLSHFAAGHEAFRIKLRPGSAIVLPAA